ncbi:MAG: DUF1287 domain-containing protein [Campylobacteraceae bacterium]|nr:DUF1287 domain-containing protein [Campylobacteraceae bacterium]
MKKTACALLFFCTFVFGDNADFSKRLSDVAVSLTNDNVSYNAAYFKIAYPNGDIPPEFGVCTDVVIRAYRKVDIDLQQLVHEDMAANFDKYPKNWGTKKTDKNIDHRRVPNLMKFFERHGTIKPITKNAEDYVQGDIVAWKLENGSTHIGIVADKKSHDGQRHMIVHNIGFGQVLEDCLFSYKIIGHYVYQ